VINADWFLMEIFNQEGRDMKKWFLLVSCFILLKFRVSDA